jgi:hypothetical protein
MFQPLSPRGSNLRWRLSRKLGGLRSRPGQVHARESSQDSSLVEHVPQALYRLRYCSPYEVDISNLQMHRLLHEVVTLKCKVCKRVLFLLLRSVSLGRSGRVYSVATVCFRMWVACVVLGSGDAAFGFNVSDNNSVNSYTACDTYYKKDLYPQKKA